MRRFAVPFAVLLCLVTSVGMASAAPPVKPTPGAAGIGDPYFPDDGNGGYDVQHYDLDLSYEPSTDVLSGTATIAATATQFLSRFNLDLDGLKVRSITVNGAAAKWHRSQGELVITPASPLPDAVSFTTVIVYDGIPGPIPDNEFGGWIPTDDGVVVAGQPHGAATWFPANDHPIDKASFTFHVSVPAGLQAVANGRLESVTTAAGRTTWTWDAVEPMATYLATINVGEFDLDDYSADGVDYWDAIDPDLFDPVAAPRTGTQFAMSQVGRRSRTSGWRARSACLPAGAQLSFWIDRDTEFPWDFVFVEIHTVGQDDWTTLADLNGHTSQDTGFVCPFWLDIHPFLTHYQTGTRKGCDPSGTSGELVGGHRRQRRRRELGVRSWCLRRVRRRGLDLLRERRRRPAQTVSSSTTSSCPRGRARPPSRPTATRWTAGRSPARPRAAPATTTTGSSGRPRTSRRRRARSRRVRSRASRRSSTSWDRTSGRTRSRRVAASSTTSRASGSRSRRRRARSTPAISSPIRSRATPSSSTRSPTSGTATASPWRAGSTSGSTRASRLYAEWLWSEDEGLGTAQEIFDFWNEVFPAEDPFWGVVIGDPGPDQLFDFAVYIRGGDDAAQLRLAVGDDDFFEILADVGGRPTPAAT